MSAHFLSLRQKILLIYIASDESPIDPIRIMKGLFLFAQEAPTGLVPSNWRYEFEPYHYGPCSFDMYKDLDFLVHTGLVRSLLKPGFSWNVYAPLHARKNLVSQISTEIPQQVVQYVKDLRIYINSLSMHTLLATIYKEYPYYATKSVFQF